MILFASILLAGCAAVPAGSDQILARDLAPAFSGVEQWPQTYVALAPAPGVQRHFGLAELGRLASRLGIDAAPERDLCFERAVRPLEPKRILEAMRRTLPEAVIQILDYCRWGAPEGDLDFPRSGLRRSGVAAIWNGEVRYGGTRRFRIWAKVQLTVSTSTVVAGEDLSAGQTLDAASLRVETRDDFSSAVPFAGPVEQLQGRVLRRAVRAGTPIRPEWLAPEFDVRRGDSVRVEVRRGGAHLELDCVAAGSGNEGQAVMVINPESHKRFSARVDGKGKVSVGKENQ